MTRRVPVINRALGMAALLCLVACLAAGESRAAAPTPTAADPAMPNSIAVLGDSMSVATGTQGIPSSEQPQNSWSTGTNSSVNSLYQRILALNPSINGNNYNLAGNGEDMLDGPNQANATPSNSELVTIQLGGNNICKDSAAQMTSLTEYRNKLVETLNNLQTRMPNSLIQVSSVPDIYNLWFLRGAPNPPNDQPSSRAGTARVFWDTLSLIPCKSMVDNPTSMSQADIDRREMVRQRNIDYNEILAEECEARLRCRFDRYATFNFSSNRTTPPDGPYLPRAQWQFVDDDISTIDHFHPSTSGQRKMAEAVWTTGYDFTDSVMPASTASISPAPLQSGVSFLPSTVTVNWSDQAGIKGVQYRIHQGGNTGAWQTQLGTTTGAVNQSQSYGYLNQKSISIPVSTPGTTYLESRAMDTNGNLSASRVTEVIYDPNAVPAPDITATPPTITASSTAGFSFTGAVAGTTYECSLDGASFTSCSSPKTYNSVADGAHEFRVRLNSGSNTGPADSYSWTIDSSAPPPPVISEGPPAQTKVTVATFIFSGAEAALECSLDEGAFAACVSPHQVSVPADGVHTFEVRQKTIVGVPGTSAIYTWTVDNTAPLAPAITDGPASPTKSTSAAISFSGEDGGVFRCQLDGGAVSACGDPGDADGVWNRSGLTEGQHTFSVYQRDDVNNQGPAATFTWTVDTTAPVAPVIGSGPPAETSSGAATITFSGEAGGFFECSLDGASFFFCSSPRNLTGLEEGDHELRIRQTDAAGNTGPSSARDWSVDATPPEAPVLTGGPPVLTNSASASFSFTGEPGGSFECSTDGAGFSSCTSPVNLSSLSDGDHQFSVRQVDDLGNTGETTARSWTVDTTPPAAPVLHPDTLDIKTTLTLPIGFTGEPGGSFECRTDEGPWISCSSPWTATFAEDGIRTFDVRQTDAAGNTGPAARGSKSISVTILEPPTITSAPSGTVRSTSAQVTFDLAAGATGRCILNGGVPQACDGTWSATGLDQGDQWLLIGQSTPLKYSEDVLVQWTVDTFAPKLTGQVRAKAKGKAKKGKPRTYVLTTSHDRKLGKPASLEFSIAAKKPPATARPAKSRTRKWAPKLTIKSKKKLTWVRVFDPIGNASGWYRVR